MYDEETIKPSKKRVIIVVIVEVLIFLFFGIESKIFRFSIFPFFFIIISYFTGFKLPQYQVDVRKLRASVLAGLVGSILSAFIILWIQEQMGVREYSLLVWFTLPISYIVSAIIGWKLVSRWKGW